MLLGGPFLVISTFLIRHSFLSAFPRYGLSMLPIAMAVLAVASGTRLALGAVSVLAGGSMAVVLWYLLRAGG